MNFWDKSDFSSNVAHIELFVFLGVQKNVQECFEEHAYR